MRWEGGGAFTWERLARLDEAVGWHRDPENAPLAHVWHLENVAELAAEIRRLMTEREIDEHLISLLWAQVPGDERGDVIARLQDVRSPQPGGASRLAEIVDRAAEGRGR